MIQIINSKFLLVNSDYFIFTKQRKRFMRVDGKKIHIKGFEDFEFFFYKQGDDVIICEAFTGTRVSTEDGGFIKVLKSTTNEICDLGKMQLKKKFDLMLKITKLSPRYRYICNPSRK